MNICWCHFQGLPHGKFGPVTPATTGRDAASAASAAARDARAAHGTAAQERKGIFEVHTI